MQKQKQIWMILNIFKHFLILINSYIYILHFLIIIMKQVLSILFCYNLSN